MIGQIVQEWLPQPDNARNTEGSFVTLRDGRVLFIYTRFGATGGDGGAADLVARTSSDGGQTWSADRVVLRNDARNVMSVSLLRLADGRIGMVYLRKEGDDFCMPLWRVSEDDGETFSPPTAMIRLAAYYVGNNDRLIQLRSGRLVMPVSHHRVRPTLGSRAAGRDHHFARRALVFFLLSDDAGQSWVESSDALYAHGYNGDGLQEPGVVELASGELWSYSRPSATYADGRQWESFSRDGGDNWTPVRRSQFFSPCSPMSVKRLANGHLLAIWNDHSGRFATAPVEGSWGRTPLVSAISRDEGESWTQHTLLETEPRHGYCYTAIHQVGDQVLLAYCAGGPSTKGVLNRMVMRRIPLAALDTP
jgi:sialidase-1